MNSSLDLFRREVNSEDVKSAIGLLGDSLVGWLLNERALACAPHPIQSSTLSTLDELGHKGLCWVVFAMHDSLHPYDQRADKSFVLNSEKPGLLKPGCILPFYWAKDEPDDDWLPEEILSVAIEVRETMSEQERISDQFGLRAAFGRAPCLEELIDTAGSGWAMLAAGFWAAATNGRLLPHVWATATRKKALSGKTTFNAVDDESLPNKIWAAQSLRATDFFVADVQASSAKEYAQSKLSIGNIDSGTEKVLSALEQFRIKVRADPGENADDETLQDHYVSLIRTPRANAFYRERLMAPIAERISTTGSHSHKPITHLVGILSHSDDLLPLLQMATNPCAILVLHSGIESSAVHRVTNRLNKDQVDVIAKEFDQKNMRDDLRRLVENFRSETGAQYLTFDLTSANKLMSYELAFGTARQGIDQFLYIGQEFSPGNVRLPLTETAYVWQTGQSLFD